LKMVYQPVPPPKNQKSDWKQLYHWGT
jgi:hypothetical protein